MKVIAKKTYPSLSHIFSEGDVLELTPILYEEDTKVQNSIYGKNMGKQIGWVFVNTSKLNKEHLPEGVVKIFDEVVAKKGTYKGCTIKNLSVKGNRVFDTQNLFGSFPLDKFFKKKI